MLLHPLFSVHINGKAFGNILPSRGLHQGDPLSPYLFILYVEGFMSLLAKAEEDRRLHGISICRRAPSISHLLFANESLLFCQANQQEVQSIMILCSYMRLLQANVGIATGWIRVGFLYARTRPADF